MNTIKISILLVTLFVCSISLGITSCDANHIENIQIGNSPSEIVCNSIIVADSSKDQKKGSIKKGIKFQNLSYKFPKYEKTVPSCDTEKTICQTNLKQHYDKILVNQLDTPFKATTWKKYLCKILGSNFEGKISFKMEYECNNSDQYLKIANLLFSYVMNCTI